MVRTPYLYFIIKELESHKPHGTVKNFFLIKFKKKDVSHWEQGFGLIHCSSSASRKGILVVQSPSHVWLFATTWTTQAMPPCSSIFPEVCPSSCPLHQWCHSVISSSDILFLFCPQSLPASGTFPKSQLFTSDDQNTGSCLVTQKGI